MKRSIGTARSFLPVGTPSAVARSWNRAALAALIARSARAMGLGPDLTREQMAGLAQAARDNDANPPLSAATEQAIRAALRTPLTVQDDPATVAAELFQRLPDAPLPVRGPDGRAYLLVALPL